MFTARDVLVTGVIHAALRAGVVAMVFDIFVL